MPDYDEPERTLQVGELDELQTFVGKKKQNRSADADGELVELHGEAWIWIAVDHFKPGILGWVLGDHSAKTFEPLWEIVRKWKCYFYVTDGWKVYPNFIPERDQIISKTYRTHLTSLSFWVG